MAVRETILYEATLLWKKETVSYCPRRVASAPLVSHPCLSPSLLDGSGFYFLTLALHQRNVHG